MNQIKNENPSKAPITPINRQKPPPQINDTSVFSCFNYRKLGHMIKKCKIEFKPCVDPNAYVNLIDEPFIALITKIDMIIEFDG